MAKAAAVKAKTQQRSITSFFGAPAAPKRKAPAEDESTKADAAAAVTTPAKKPKRSPVKKKTKPRKKEQESPVEPSSMEVDEEDAEAEKEVEAEKEEEAENEEEEEEKEESDAAPSSPVAKQSPVKPKMAGRRRLRQRVVSDDESDDDLVLPPAKAKQQPKKKANAIVDVTSDQEENSDVEIVSKTEAPKAEVQDAADEEEKDGDKEEKDEKEEEEEEKEENEEEVSEASEGEEGDEEEEEEDEEEEEVEDVEEEKPKAKKKPHKPANSFFSAAPAKKTTPKASKSSAKIKSESGTKIESGIPEDAGTVPYASLAVLFSKIEAISGRLEIQDLLTNFFQDVLHRAPQDLLACIYLCVCTDLAPPFENLKIGIGDAILMKAIGEATGTNLKFIKEMYHKEGDLGKVAQNARSKQHTLAFAPLKPAANAKPPAVLSVPDVYNQFVKIAKMTGNNSQQQKCSIIKSLLVKCEKDKKSGQGDNASAEAAKFIIRGLQGKLRIGLAEKSILMSLTYAFMLPKDQKDKEKQQQALVHVKKAFAESPSYNALVQAFQVAQEEAKATQFGVEHFKIVAERCVLTPGTPVSPMLARPTKAYAMVFDRFEGQPFTCEYKYDGERAQIHILENGEIAIFSRNFENSTERFPDVKLMISKAAKRKNVSCIVDAEVVAVDKATNKRLPFQILSTRSRKNVKVEDIKVPVCIYAFDMLYLDGKSMLTESLARRREILRETFAVTLGEFEYATSMDVSASPAGLKDDSERLEQAVEQVRTFLEQAVVDNCEGLMVKTLETEATYEPANRSHKWLKLKKDYLDGIGDSTDLVPIGAFHGRGKRTGVYGAYLLACYDPDTEMFQPITKLGTGLSDEVLKQFYEQLKATVVDKPPSDYAVSDAMKPDVWFSTTTVWEILGADLSISPKYTAAMGLVARDKGISLRFPRFIRTREDKKTTQATTAAQIADLYRAQGLTTVSGGDNDDDDDDMLI